MRWSKISRGGQKYKPSMVKKLAAAVKKLVAMVKNLVGAVEKLVAVVKKLAPAWSKNWWLR